MRHLRFTIVAAAAAMLGLTSATAAVTVTYVNPEKMTDVPRFESDRKSMEIDLREFLEEQAKKLPAGQDLKVEFLDIDLAGDVFPRVPVRDIRVTKGSYDFPRISLRFSIEQNGTVLRSGQRDLADRNYQLNVNSFRNEMYSYEKQMLAEWFKKDILAGQ